MTKKIYLLYCDVDNGNNEDWSIFYTPVEAFATSEDREERVSYILSQNPALDPEENFVKETVEIFHAPGQIQGPLPHTLEPKDFYDDDNAESSAKPCVGVVGKAYSLQELAEKITNNLSSQKEQKPLDS